MFCAQYYQYVFLPQYWHLICSPNTDIVMFSAQNGQLIFLRINVHLISPPPPQVLTTYVFFAQHYFYPVLTAHIFYPSTSYILSSPSSDRLYFPLRTDSLYCAPCKAKLSASTYWKKYDFKKSSPGAKCRKNFGPY